MHALNVSQKGEVTGEASVTNGARGGFVVGWKKLKQCRLVFVSLEMKRDGSLAAEGPGAEVARVVDACRVQAEVFLQLNRTIVAFGAKVAQVGLLLGVGSDVVPVEKQR